MNQAKYNVYVQLPNGKTRLEVLGGKSALTLAQSDWLFRQYKKGRFTGYRRELISPKKSKPKPLTLQERAWREATRLVGVMETPGKNNTGPSIGGRPGVTAIIRENGGSGPEPWCGDAVAHFYRVAGSKAVNRQWASVRALGGLAGQKKISPRKMQQGDIVCYDFGTGSDHTGLFGYYGNSQGKPVAAEVATHIIAIEGNTGKSGAVSDSKTGGDGVYLKLREIGLVDRGVRVTR
jgi:hypothetical protein